MITAIVNVKVKQDLLDEYIEIASLLTKESRNRDGCISYVFNQSLEKETEFSLFEQWASEEHLNAHIEALIDLLGAPDLVVCCQQSSLICMKVRSQNFTVQSNKRTHNKLLKRNKNSWPSLRDYSQPFLSA